MKRLKSTTRQRGIALMMTLGVLALLLIMALSFAYTTRTERLAAGVNADLIRARLLAESGVERAMAFLREQYPGNPAPGTQFFVPTTAGGVSDPPWVFDPAVTPPGRGGRYLGSVNPAVKVSVGLLESNIEAALASTIRVGGTASQFTPASTLHDAVGWIPIKVNHGAGTESCVGLVGYLVIDETGKIDPSLAVGSIYGTTSEATSNPDTRLGLDMREIAMADCAAEDGSFPQPFSYGQVVGDLFYSAMPSPGRWHSIYHIMNAFSSYGANQAWLNRFTWSLRPFSVEEPEAYSDTSGGVLNHRCDINAIDWNTIDVASFPLGQLAATQPYNVAAVGIPWIGQIMPITVRNQAIANVIDFLDDDVGGGAPTDTENDYTVTGPGPVGTATYVGLEEVPYINEILVRARYERADVRLVIPPIIPPPGILIGYNKTVYIDAQVELVNLYETARTVPNTQLQLSTEFRWIGGIMQTRRTDFTWSSVAVAANQHLALGWQSDSFTAFFPVGEPGNIPAFRVTEARAVESRLTPAATASMWDCALVGAMDAGTAAIDLVDGDGFRMASAEVNDPRCNTSGTGGAAANWDWISFGGAGVTTIGSAGAVNDRCDPTAPGNDAETAADPTAVATAFIRNGPVVSFWELGAIHRGEPWRTLNLHSSDQAAASVGLYSYGDWPLLNQIKLTAATTARGGINVWAVQPPVWKPLLQGIRLGSAYGDPCGSGSELTDNANLALATQLIAAAAPAWSNAAGAVHGRAAIVRYARLAGIDAAGADESTLDPLLGARGTDALQEEVIGKVVGLLNDRISYYTIIVCAKAVQDVGTLPTGMTAATCPRDWIEYEAGPPARYCRPMSEQKVMALVWRDVATSQFRIASFEYLED